MNVFADTMVLTGRMMKHMTRSVDTIMTVVLMPIMLMLAFIYIFGGAMTIPQETYKGFIVPAILLFTVASDDQCHFQFYLSATCSDQQYFNWISPKGRCI